MDKNAETIAIELMMRTYLAVSGFEQKNNCFSEGYGWSFTRCLTAETYLGDGFSQQAYKETPKPSRERMVAHLCRLLP